MSVKVSTWAWHDEATAELKIGQMLVLLALADIANDDGDVVFVSDRRRDGEQGALAVKCHMSVAAFRRITGELRDLGLLSIERDTQTSPNRYRVLLTAQSERSIRAVTAQDERSDRSSVGGHTPLKRINVNEGVPAGRGSRLPADWKPSEILVQWAAAKAPSVNVEVESENFADYWKAAAGAKGVKLDWDATWRTWMRRTHERNVERGWTAELVDVGVEQWMLR